MLKKSIILITLAIYLSGSNIHAQDPHFSQFYANPLYLNPAFAGTVVCPRISLNYRNQWANIPPYWNTYSVSYDVHRDYLSGGIGFQVMADQAAGIISTYSGSAMYSYNLSTGPNFNIKVGFEARYFIKQLDWDKLYFGDQISDRWGFVYNTKEVTPGKLSKSGPDFSVGMLGYNKSYFFGIALHHLTEPNEGFLENSTDSHLPRKLTIHAGAIFDVNIEYYRGKRLKRRVEDPTFSPNFIFQWQRNLKQFNYGFYYNQYPLILGLWYRHSFSNIDAIIALVGLQMNVLKVGYSYDLTVSKLGAGTGGSHEISVGWKLPCKPEKKRIKVIHCPTF